MPLHKTLRKRSLRSSREGGGQQTSQKGRGLFRRLLRSVKSWRRRSGGKLEVPTRPGHVVKASTPTSEHVNDPKPQENLHPKDSLQVSPLETEKDQQPLEPEPEPEPSHIHEEPKEDTMVDADTPLGEEQVSALFNGAPQFSVHEVEGRQQPQVTHPRGHAVPAESSNCPPLSHPAFSAATLRRHLPTGSAEVDTSEGFIGYDIGVVEVPSMLSAQGHEAGTIGFDHFLQLPISDNLQVHEESEQDTQEIEYNADTLYNSPEKLGIRHIVPQLINERIQELGDLYHDLKSTGNKQTLLDRSNPPELYANLFGKFLTPPRFDPDAGDPTGLKVQIETLMQVLKIKGIWHDFSLVEWRIRVGQLLWASEGEQGEPTPPPAATEWITVRQRLLLQVVLAAELLLRLDAITSLDPDELVDDIQVTVEEVQKFKEMRDRKIDWDLVLARRFLEDIQVLPSPNGQVPELADYYSSSSPKRSLFPAYRVPSPGLDQWIKTPEALLVPRHQSRQVEGLLHFAESIAWPDIQSLRSHITTKLDGLRSISTSASPSIYSTPLATPQSFRTTRGDYFTYQDNRPRLSRNNTQQLPMPLHSQSLDDSTNSEPSIGGWLSRTYLTGLVLPGEAIEHLLISTLFENDPMAMAALGDSANLYGGFVYQDRSWWSKTSIVGRVMATVPGSRECMGWIMVPLVPEGLPDGWVDVTSESILNTSKPRVEDIAAVGKGSDMLGGFWASDILANLLVLPRDGKVDRPDNLRLTTFNLQREQGEDTADEDTPLTKREALDYDDDESEVRYTASLTFLGGSSLRFDERNTDMSCVGVQVSLKHDVSFVSSFPCSPPTGPSIIDKTPPSPGTARLSRTATQSLTTHPLPKSYVYRTVPASELLADMLTSNELANAATSRGTPQSFTCRDGNDPVAARTTVVIDARSSWEAQLLSRAWCADIGSHAVVSRVGRTCLACSIREARALGVGVVVRVG